MVFVNGFTHRRKYITKHNGIWKAAGQKKILPMPKGLLHMYSVWKVKARELQVQQYELFRNANTYGKGSMVFADVSQAMSRRHVHEM